MADTGKDPYPTLTKLVNYVLMCERSGAKATSQGFRRFAQATKKSYGKHAIKRARETGVIVVTDEKVGSYKVMKPGPNVGTIHTNIHMAIPNGGSR